MQTSDPAYAHWRARSEAVWWKRLLDVQRPYRWHLRRLRLGTVLDIGCGTGRNLAHLDGHGVGVDHNATAVSLCRSRGLTAFTPAEFVESSWARPGSFDTLLFSHIAEHLEAATLLELLQRYLPYLRAAGRVVFLTPQEMGYRSDPTHLRFMDFAALDEIERAAGLKPVAQTSFPLPRMFGRLFKYNEFVSISVKPAAVECDPAAASHVSHPLAHQ